jgi:hypothetical protein
VSIKRIIRPPDPVFDRGLPPRVGRYSSAKATQIALHCYGRDVSTVLDLTYAHGGCWRWPVPADLTVVPNNWDPSASTPYHHDYTENGFADRSWPGVVWDPIHLGDLGKDSFMRQRYGTVAGAAAHRDHLVRGAAESWRITDVVLIVKLTDGLHGGRLQQLTRWVEEAIGAQPCGDLTATRARPSPRPPGEIPRVPPNNSAVWLVFRRDGQDGRYPDFISLYERQEASRIAALAAQRRCLICDNPIGNRRGDAATCSDACRQRARRQRRQSA